MKRVYVGCALTHAPLDKKEAFMHLLEDIKSSLAKRGYEVLPFLSAIEKSPTPERVYSFDIGALNAADCFLALGEYASTGLGYELCYAAELRKIPIMVVSTAKARLSNLIRGIPYPYVRCVEYTEDLDIAKEFDTFVTTFYEKNK